MIPLLSHSSAVCWKDIMIHILCFHSCWAEQWKVKRYKTTLRTHRPTTVVLAACLYTTMTFKLKMENIIAFSPHAQTNTPHRHLGQLIGISLSANEPSSRRWVYAGHCSYCAALGIENLPHCSNYLSLDRLGSSVLASKGGKISLDELKN